MATKAALAALQLSKDPNKAGEAALDDIVRTLVGRRGSGETELNLSYSQCPVLEAAYQRPCSNLTEIRLAVLEA